MQFASFAEVAARYDAVFFDAFGVLKNFHGVLPDVDRVLRELREAGKSVMVVTNDSSRSPDELAEAYRDANGDAMLHPEQFISSGMLTEEYLRARLPYGRVAFLGKPQSAHYIEMAGLIPVPIAECTKLDRIVGVALLDDEGFDWFHDINRTVNLVRQLDVPVIVANADLTYPMQGSDVGLAVGSLAWLISTITGRDFVVFGKPDALMFERAMERAQASRPGLTKERVLFVGDTIRTDIAGASAFGLDTVLVMTGNTLPSEIDSLTKAAGVTPTYVCESVTT